MLMSKLLKVQSAVSRLHVHSKTRSCECVCWEHRKSQIFAILLLLARESLLYFTSLTLFFFSPNCHYTPRKLQQDQINRSFGLHCSLFFLLTKLLFFNFEILKDHDDVKSEETRTDLTEAPLMSKTLYFE